MTPQIHLLYSFDGFLFLLKAYFKNVKQKQTKEAYDPMIQGHHTYFNIICLPSAFAF